ncbi:MAG TPA: universal stress protein [Deinococcales bacterium]|nr:universal stress protein [Deinococcales bacterium]
MPEKPEPDFSTSQPLVPDPDPGSPEPATEDRPLIGPVPMPAHNKGPEDILRSLLRQRRGRHKVYVGAAPGVGKTYRALQELRERLTEGQDVLIGHLETHNRQDVKAMAEGIPFFPRKAYESNGVIRTDLDLDGLLERKPQVVFVDELAHSNAAGARHKKRFIDVDELLNAGINVISTLNIQHLESLNDLVTRMTGVRVKEKIPDRVILEANEVVLVDVSPEQLQERLKAGKIFAPDRVEQALSSFFTEETLVNLRELALRQVAEAVEEAPAPEETLGRGVKERIVVAVSGDPNAARLIRRGARIAQRLKGEMLVVHVRHRTLDPEEEEALAAHEQLTSDLDGHWFSVPAGNVASALISFVREHDVNQIILGESHRSRLDEFVRGSIIHEVLRRTHDVDVYVIADED